MKDLSRNVAVPWAVLGDFNDIASSHEKFGGGIKDPKSALNFIELINECKLKSIASKGVKFTWSNKRLSGANVQENIDRVLANLEWFEKVPNCVVQNLPMVGSDHCHIVLQHSVKEKRATTSFKFELFWSEEKECNEAVKENWKTNRTGSFSFKLMKKLKTCKNGLLEWSRAFFPNSAKEIEKVMQKLVELQNVVLTKEVKNQIKECEEQLEVLWKRDEQFWFQRSIIKWLIRGDRNTRFFHQRTIHRDREIESPDWRRRMGTRLRKRKK